jgi:hypothetical protein
MMHFVFIVFMQCKFIPLFPIYCNYYVSVAFQTKGGMWNE